MRAAPRNSDLRVGLERKKPRKVALKIPFKSLKGPRLLAQFFSAVITYFVIFLAAILNAVGVADFENLTWALIIFQSIRFGLERTWGSLTLSLGVTFFALFALPSVGMILFEANPPIETLSAFVVASDALRSFSSQLGGGAQKRFAKSDRRSLVLFSSLQAWMLISPFVINGGALLTLMAPLSVSLIVLEMMLRNGRKSIAYFALMSMAAVLFSHIIFHWSGFGRLVVGSYTLLIVFVISRYVDIGFRMWIVPIILPLALYFAQLSRYGSVDDLRTLVMGSAAHHLIVTSDAKSFAYSGSAEGWSEFVDQYSLMFFNWFPRSIWPEKPLGAGLTSVDAMYSRNGYSAGYSQSLGFLGEQYYLLGTSAFWGTLVVIATLIMLRRFIASQSSIFYTPLAAFDVSLISFFWGGMAIFGSRVWFFILPSLTLIMLHRIRSMSRTYRRITN